MSADTRRIALLVEELGRSGGMAVIRRHAAHMRRVLGWDAVLVVTGPNTADLPSEQDGVPVTSIGAAGHARWDAAVATWWATTDHLWALPADRQVLFLQNLEHRFYRQGEQADQLAAISVLDLPADFVVIADYMVELLADLRPDARVVLVRNGVDKNVFTGSGERERDPDAPLRVLIEGHPTLWFKGVRDALRAVEAMTAPHATTLVVHDPEDLQDIDLPVEPDVTLGGVDHVRMAELYAEHDVLLKLSRFEGSPLPPLEAFHVGTPVVITPFTGHEEQVEDHVNGLIVGFDDPHGTARALDRLAVDAELWNRLSAGARASADRWPTTEESSAMFANALAELLEAAPVDPEPGLDRLSKARRRTAEEVRRERASRRDLEGELTWYRDAYEQAKETAAEHHAVAMARKAEIEELAQHLEVQLDNVRDRDATVRELLVTIEELRETLRLVRGSRAYRLGLALRRPLDAVRKLRR